MGVPAFFRWLTKKYPSVIVHCIEEKNGAVDGTQIPVDSSAPNPNGVEFDNLYLDMNGIIHPCTHPEDKPAPKNEDEMMIAIFECIDRLFRIVRPRKVLYMAIDGVAPRAKMNQQRSRRFRASKETYEKIKEIDRVREELLVKGCELPPAKEKGEHFDSNCITPGTPFMDRLSKCLHYYIHDRLNNDPGWSGIKVFLSDANVPGEGEHKIMDFIRRQRAMPDHDPNTAHVLCGADADLIMLGLATHEPNFTIIREEFKPNKPRPCDICNQIGHEMKDCLGLEKEVSGEHDEISVPFASEVEFIFVRLNVLREYLEKELEMPNLPFPFELERAIDDWVFMCFFVGNDFLPHLPSLEIREGAIDRLVELYKKTVYKTGGWLTDSGIPDLSRVQLIMSDLGDVEDEIFKNRQQNEVRFKERMKQQKRRKMFEQQANSNCYNRPSYIPGGQFAPVAIGNIPSAISEAKNEAFNMRRQGMHGTTVVDSASSRSNNAAAAALRSLLNDDSPKSSNNSSRDSSFNSSLNRSNSSADFSPSPSPSPSSSPFHGTKRPFNEEEEEDEPNDEVRLWEDGFKDRYYESKFDVGVDNMKFRNEVASQYVTGLCWVLRYYYQGCASWKWYFPYHYAPFASDFINIGDLSTEFEKATEPFKPLEQLMGVFPAASRSHVPQPWGELMIDPDSSIIDFYPEDFQIDLNGKKFAWQGVALLPFVDEVRLKAALKSCYDLLTDDEKKRNVRGDDRLYVRRGHKGYDFLAGLYENELPAAALDSKEFDGVSGTVLISQDRVPEKGELKSPIKDLLDIEENYVISVRYRDPTYEEDYIFPAKRLEGAKDPPKVLKPGDLNAEQSRNWRPMIGMTHSNQRAYLGNAGHRMMANEGYDRNRSYAGQGQYSNMPPPVHSHGGSGGIYRGGERSLHQNRYQPYNVNDRRGGGNGGGHYNNQRGGGGGSWNNNNRNGNYNQGSSYNSQHSRYEDRSRSGSSYYGQGHSYSSSSGRPNYNGGPSSNQQNRRGQDQRGGNEGRGYFTTGYFTSSEQQQQQGRRQ